MGVNFTVQADVLKDATSKLSYVLKGGNANGEIFFEVNEPTQTIIARGTNFDTFSVIKFEAQVKESSQFVISGTLLSSIISKAKGEISFNSTDDNRIAVQVNSILYKIQQATENPETFKAPEIEQGKVIKIQAQQLKLGIQEVICCSDPSRTHLYAVVLHSEGNKLRIVATDGMKLGIAECEATFEGEIPNIIIPKKTADYLVNIIGTKEGEIELKYTENSLKVTAGSYSFTTQLLDTGFPKYQGVVPTEFNNTIEVNVSELKNAVFNVSTVLELSNRIEFNISKDKIELTTEDQGNKANCVIEAPNNYNGEDIKYVFFYNSIGAILSSIKDEKVQFKLQKELDKPILVQPVGNDTVKYVMMPVIS